MFDIGIGFSELMLLAVVVIIVVGPEELPSLLRTVGRYFGQVKRIADDFRSQVDEAIRDPLEEIQESIEGVTENLDDDPFGEEELIDFEEHNKKVLDKEKEESGNETATEKALRDSGLTGFDAVAAQQTEPDPDAKPLPKVQDEQIAQDSDAVLAKKSGT